MEESAKEKVLKLLELSASENDAEALSALRKANEIREKAEMAWPDFFAGSTPQSALPPIIKRPPARPKFVTVEMMLDEVLRRQMNDTLIAKFEEMRYVYELTGQLSGDECSMLINTFNGHLS